MLKNTEKKQLIKVRKIFNGELKRLKITQPKMSIRCDSRTKKLTIGYSIYNIKGNDHNGERIIGRKRKNLYLKQESLFDERALKIRLEIYINDVVVDVEKSIKRLGSEKDSLIEWSNKFSTNKIRNGNIELSELTLKNGRRTFNVLIDYLNLFEPTMLDVWNWVDNGNDVLLKFLKYKQQPNQSSELKYKRQWKNSTTKQNYNEINVFFGWLNRELEGFPKTDFLNIPLTPTKVKTSSFSQQEILKVIEFVEDNLSSKRWGWFCEMLIVLMETGCRIKEIEKMKINHLNITDRTWLIHGKGRYGGKVRLNRFSNRVWNIIIPLISDADGNVLKDKEYVFHRRYYRLRKTKENPTKMDFIEDREAPIPNQTFRQRFKLMIDELELSDDLTPHSCRRYYITQMLIKTNGNIPFVSEIVGHSNWTTTQKYAKSVLLKDTKTELGIFNTKQVSIPLMITQKMRIELKNLGYTEPKISSLKPEQAHEIIQRGF